MKVNVNACTLENSSHIFFSVSGKLPPGKFQPGKFPRIKLPPGKFPLGKFRPRKLPLGIFSPMFLNIPTRVFYFFFIIATIDFTQVFTFVNISQKERLSEERQLMKWLGIIQVRIFWVAIFRGNFPGGSLMGGNFSLEGSPPGKFL